MPQCCIAKQAGKEGRSGTRQCEILLSTSFAFQFSPDKQQLKYLPILTAINRQTHTQKLTYLSHLQSTCLTCCSGTFACHLVSVCKLCRDLRSIVLLCAVAVNNCAYAALPPSVPILINKSKWDNYSSLYNCSHRFVHIMNILFQCEPLLLLHKQAAIALSQTTQFQYHCGS